MYRSAARRDPHSFPTRRSSDLGTSPGHAEGARGAGGGTTGGTLRRAGDANGARGDRKSTRLNSSHVAISYAVFCLKKQDRPYKTGRTLSQAITIMASMSRERHI